MNDIEKILFVYTTLDRDSDDWRSMVKELTNLIEKKEREAWIKGHAEALAGVEAGNQVLVKETPEQAETRGP